MYKRQQLFQHLEEGCLVDDGNAQTFGLGELAPGLFARKHKAGLFAHAAGRAAAVAGDERLGLIPAEGRQGAGDHDGCLLYTSRCV